MNLVISGDKFLLGEKPFTILSGAIHYFRTMPDMWEDRLLKLRACGFNTVETYVAWNVHQPNEGEFDFSGIADIERFINLAGSLGLKVIVRPGPYICSEWDFGGLPWWLLKDANMYLRCADPAYLKWVDLFFDELLKRLVPLLSTKGGPIIAMQVENEYGSYGNDSEYLNYLKCGMINRGVDVLLFTSDGATDWMLQGGTLPDVFMTVNFGSRAVGEFEKLGEYQQDKPLVCMEYWNGWFDHWGEHHHTRDGDDAANVFAQMLDLGASVNFYMFHGGTNFGYMSGANYSDEIQPTITSYDDDALLDEAGDITDKYLAVKKVMDDRFGVSGYELPKPIQKAAYGSVELKHTAGFMGNIDKLSKPQRWSHPPTMERADQGYGFMLYQTRITGPREAMPLSLQDVHDRGLIFVDGRYMGTILRDDKGDKINIAVPKEGIILSILVENCGRINYGPKLKDSKGITEGVRHGRQFLYGWDVYPIDLSRQSNLIYGEDTVICPAFLKGNLKIDDVCDTFMLLKGFKKGVVFINGFNLSVYWDIGPQETMYVPASILKHGDNEIVVFEQYGYEKPIVEFIDHLELGRTE